MKNKPLTAWVTACLIWLGVFLSINFYVWLFLSREAIKYSFIVSGLSGLVASGEDRASSYLWFFPSFAIQWIVVVLLGIFIIKNWKYIPVAVRWAIPIIFIVCIAGSIWLNYFAMKFYDSTGFLFYGP